MHSTSLFSRALPLPTPTKEFELSTYDTKLKYIATPPTTTQKQELETFFAQSYPALVPDLIRIIIGYADENLRLAMKNNSRGQPVYSKDTQSYSTPDDSHLVYDDPQYQEEIGAIICALAASPTHLDPIPKQILVNGLLRGDGMPEFVKILNEMSRIREKVNLDGIIMSRGRLTGPCNLNGLSAIGTKINSFGFRQIQMRGANLNESTLTSATLIDVDLSGASLSGIKWSQVHFKNVKITGLNTNDQRLVNYMKNYRKKIQAPGSDIIIYGSLTDSALISTGPHFSLTTDCSIM